MLIGLGSSSWALGIGVAVFTFFSGVASAFLLVINIRSGQHYNYVSMLAIVIALDKFNSFAQQIYTLVNFRDLMVEAFQLATEMFKCSGSKPFPLFHTTDKTVSAFLSLQMFFVNSQGLLFFYWSLILFASSWSLSPVWWKNQKAIIGTKISCFALPAIQLGLLRLDVIRGNDFAQLIIMNCIILVNIGMGSVFLVLTLAHVISVHREARGATEVRLSRTYDGVVEFLPRSMMVEKGLKFKARAGIGRLYIGSDGWLIARIALAFVMVEGLQIYVIVMQIFFLQRWAHFRIEWSQGLLEPLIDQSEEFANICSPIPGSFTGYLFFFVFGTTAESRAEITKIRFGIRKWFCGFFSQSKDDENEKSYFNQSSFKRASKRTIGSLYDSEIESPSLSLAHTISPKHPPSFSSRRDGLILTPITTPSPVRSQPFRKQGMDNLFQLESGTNYGLQTYLSYSSVPSPVTPVTVYLGALRVQHVKAGSPRYGDHVFIPSPRATKQAFSADYRRCSAPTTPMTIDGREKSFNDYHPYYQISRESG